MPVSKPKKEVVRKIITLDWLEDNDMPESLIKWFIKQFGFVGRPTVLKLIRTMRDLHVDGTKCPDVRSGWEGWSEMILENILLHDAMNNWSDRSWSCFDAHPDDDTLAYLSHDAEYARRHMRRKSA